MSRPQNPYACTASGCCMLVPAPSARTARGAHYCDCWRDTGDADERYRRRMAALWLSDRVADLEAEAAQLRTVVAESQVVLLPMPAPRVQPTTVVRKLPAPRLKVVEEAQRRPKMILKVEVFEDDDAEEVAGRTARFLETWLAQQRGQS